MATVPVFIPHLGCPHACTFCTQKTITGVDRFVFDGVRPAIDERLSTLTGERPEIAFFGGSFTGIDRDLMIRLLDLAQDYVNRGLVSGIRCSTRPDYIDEDVLDVLSRYTISTVELGMQSLCDEVLTAVKRGHTVRDVTNAASLIKRYGFRLGGQMMIGLPKSDREKEIATARAMMEMGVDECRIYPVVVYKNTELGTEMAKGLYAPPTLDDAVSRSADCAEIFLSHGVKILRIGLCANDELTDPDTVLGGINHPAVGELVYGELFYRTLHRYLQENRITGEVILTVPKNKVSIAVGQHRKNLDKLKTIDGVTVVSVFPTDGDTLQIQPLSKGEIHVLKIT